jgi:hypothetical protein
MRPMTSTEAPPRSAKERAEVAAARVEQERDRLLETLLNAPPDPRTKTRKKKPKRRGRRGAYAPGPAPIVAAPIVAAPIAPSPTAPPPAED